MARLDDDTAVTATSDDGVYSATLSPDWAIWGPMGGYIAAVALRAAGAACGRARPASFSAQFHGVADFAPIELRTRLLLTTRVATSVEVDIVQNDRSVLRATVWGVDELDGVEHHTAIRPAMGFATRLPRHRRTLRPASREQAFGLPVLGPAPAAAPRLGRLLGQHPARRPNGRLVEPVRRRGDLRRRLDRCVSPAHRERHLRLGRRRSSSPGF